MRQTKEEASEKRKHTDMYLISNGNERSGVQVPWRPARKESESGESSASLALLGVNEPGFTFLQALSATAFCRVLLSWVQNSPFQTLQSALIMPATSQPTPTRHSLHAGSKNPRLSQVRQASNHPCSEAKPEDPREEMSLQQSSSAVVF